MDISKMSVTELQAEAYKQMVTLTNAQKNIQVIEARIMELEKTGPVKEEIKEAEVVKE